MGYETPSLDAILFDIGMSSNQLSDPSRGFSYQLDGPLDMRMSNHSETALTAETIVNSMDFSCKVNAGLAFSRACSLLGRTISATHPRLRTRQASKKDCQIHCSCKTKSSHSFYASVIRHNYKSNLWKNRSMAIWDASSSRENVMLIKSLFPKPMSYTKKHRFQALRIYINEELDELKQGLIAAEKWLKPNGLCIVVSFHSLEDAIVKSFFKTCEKGQAETYRRPNRLERAQLLKEKKEREMQWDPASLMVPAESLDVDNGTESSPRFLPSFVSLGNKVVKPTRDEQMENSRSRSAKMRVAQRTEHAPHFSSKAPFSAAL